MEVEVTSRLDRYVVQAMATQGTPGLAIAITDRNSQLHLATYGLADLAAARSVVPETLFEIGSISKCFTAIALLQLHEAGRIDLHAPVTDYVPWFEVRSEHAPITLHHLLSHTAGIINGTDFTGEARYEVWSLRRTRATMPPGSRFHYSNVGYKALGLVLEAVTGRPYPDLIRERVLAPLNMTATDSSITHRTRQRLAVGYGPWFDDRPHHPNLRVAPATWLETATADGSIASTAANMGAFARALLNRGRHLLTNASFALLTQRAIELTEEDGGGHYGYGLGILERQGRTLLSHGGGMVGHYAHLVADLDSELGVVVLTNGPGEPWTVAEHALDLARAAVCGSTLPADPSAPDLARVQGARDYGGTYRPNEATGPSFRLLTEDEQLIIECEGARVPLQARGRDSYYVAHPDFALYLLRFGREQGQVVEAMHGPTWFRHERYAGSTRFPYPAGWDAYCGHYRSHNPWYPNFRVVQRKGELVLIMPDGEEEPLTPLDEWSFRVGEPDYSPEFIQFDTVVDGQALRAVLSGCDYYRTFTP